MGKIDLSALVERYKWDLRMIKAHPEVKEKLNAKLIRDAIAIADYTASSSFAAALKAFNL